MGLELGKVQRPVRQLRKSLKGLAGDPTMQDVHDLRTRSRRVEAIAGMQIAGSEKSRNHLLKILKPFRKAAGEVRDMDVLTAKARTLARRGREASLALLLEDLHARRKEGSRTLAEAVKKDGKDVRVRLEQFSRLLDKRFEGGEGSQKHSTDAAAGLLDELSCWPEFSAENLHDFRIKVKELRYLLQLTDAAEPRFVAALERVRARIGEWHDWWELRRIAGEVLGLEQNRALLGEIDEIVSGKLRLALAAARRVRTRYLGPHRGGVVGEV
jgi:CHAD domain-containing protein